MSQQFKVGDSVVCVDASEFEGSLTQGKAYSVAAAMGDWIQVTCDSGVTIEPFAHRFRPAPPSPAGERDIEYDFYSLCVEVNQHRRRLTALESSLPSKGQEPSAVGVNDSANRCGTSKGVGEAPDSYGEPVTERTSTLEEFVRGLGRMKNTRTHQQRRNAIESHLKSDGRSIRDAAGLALADMDDPASIPALREAIAKETSDALRKDLTMVLQQLEATLKAAPSVPVGVRAEDVAVGVVRALIAEQAMRAEAVVLARKLYWHPASMPQEQIIQDDADQITAFASAQVEREKAKNERLKGDIADAWEAKRQIQVLREQAENSRDRWKQEAALASTLTARLAEVERERDVLKAQLVEEPVVWNPTAASPPPAAPAPQIYIRKPGARCVLHPFQPAIGCEVCATTPSEQSK